ncbi:Rossmann-fold NAD(P)-binding domain-containing protein [Acidaminococcus timonensis]|uniref:lactate dehydrogenase n=1 Tax=Acidaminococcus timonensis TaxID=1871002 RepID=UPI0008D96401|nr:lactate dehydrogenase [Acidaminococcus timonensis]
MENNWLHLSDLPREAGVTRPLSLAGRPALRDKNRVHILALGDVGRTMLIGLRLLGADSIASLGLCDLNRKNLERLEIEINQIRYPFPKGDQVLPPVDLVDEDHLFACDVFIFCATKGTPPIGAKGDMRMVQLEANRELVRHFGELARKAKFRGLACIVSDPVDNLCRAFLESSGLAPWQVQGYGLGVMHARACYYAEKDPRLVHYLTEGRAFGPHGQDLVIADSLDHYDDALSRELTRKTVTCNLAVRELGYKPYLAPALSSAALSILLTLRGEWHYGSLYLGDETEGAFLGMKNRLTEKGFEYEDAALCPELYDRVRHAYLNLCRMK